MKSSRRRSRIKRRSGDNLITVSSQGGSPRRSKVGNWAGSRRDWQVCNGRRSYHTPLLVQHASPLRPAPLALLVHPYSPSGTPLTNLHTIPTHSLTYRRGQTDWPRSFQLSPDIDVREVASARWRRRSPSCNFPDPGRLSVRRETEL